MCRIITRLYTDKENQTMSAAKTKKARIGARILRQVVLIHSEPFEFNDSNLYEHAIDEAMLE